MGKPWFGVKQFGLGLSPRSWEGWVATVAYVLAMWSFSRWAPQVLAAHGLSDNLRWVGIGAITLAFLALIAVKSDGKPWRWRWGRD